MNDEDNKNNEAYKRVSKKFDASKTNNWEAMLAKQWGISPDSEDAQSSMITNAIERLKDMGYSSNQIAKINKDTKTGTAYQNVMKTLQREYASRSGYQELIDAEADLAAAQAAYNVGVNQRWQEAVADAISKSKTYYQNGLMSREDYITSLSSIMNNAYATAEQKEEAREAIEETRIEQYGKKFEKSIG